MLGAMPRDWEAYYRLFSGPDAPAFVVRAYGPELPPGPVLDLAGGGGRNAFFLASRGHRVLVLEKSRAALARLVERARRAQLPVHPVLFDLEDDAEPLPPGPFAGAVMSYFVHRPLLHRLAERLVPGGLVLIEGFGRLEAVRRGRPESPRYWEPFELARPPSGFALRACGEGWLALAHRAWAVWRRL